MKKERKRVKESREQYRMTQVGFAEDMSVPVTYISSVELRISFPRRSTYGDFNCTECFV